MAGGQQIGAPTGGSEGTGTLNVATGYYANGTAGLSSSGVICSGTFTSVDGLVTACTAVSDERLKQEIEPFRYGLDAIMQLRPSVWKFTPHARDLINGLPDSLQVGEIAQDFQNVMPEFVSSEIYHGEKYLSLPQGDKATIAALVNAVQEQQREIEKLRARLDELVGMKQRLGAEVSKGYGVDEKKERFVKLETPPPPATEPAPQKGQSK